MDITAFSFCYLAAELKFTVFVHLLCIIKQRCENFKMRDITSKFLKLIYVASDSPTVCNTSTLTSTNKLLLFSRHPCCRSQMDHL